MVNIVFFSLKRAHKETIERWDFFLYLAFLQEIAEKKNFQIDNQIYRFGVLIAFWEILSPIVKDNFVVKVDKGKLFQVRGVKGQRPCVEIVKLFVNEKISIHVGVQNSDMLHILNSLTFRKTNSPNTFCGLFLREKET